jgi:hypothetical protein
VPSPTAGRPAVSPEPARPSASPTLVPSPTPTRR